MLKLLKLPRWLAGALLLFCAVPAQANVHPITVIHFNPGGAIGDFLDEFTTIEESRGRVVIDGECISACTMVLGLVSLDRVCATPRGVFAFHTASIRGKKPDEEPAFSKEGTEIIWWIYPKNVRDWLLTQGMTPDKAHPNLIFTDATRFVRPCK